MDLEKSYMVLEFNDRTQDIIKLKSAMYGLSLEDIIIKALSQFEGEYDTMPCPHCKSEIKRKPYAVKKVMTIGGITHEIIVRDFPHFKCIDCRQEFQDARINTYVDRILERHIQSIMLEGKTVPPKINFKSLIDFNES
ncbi:hypothetical protein ABD87_14860 [Lysinibacillus sphaericus]|uniref:hypothetical protein n=1 Tax=Lysinibacillus sphaericus TaxID=1421 RepID=UPI0018CF9E9E|nr:hypothetical protein [Lysinibacillus sphaericus]MBG9730776.1 hypothetical protein [Lysinibacillus sphaericus]